MNIREFHEALKYKKTSIREAVVSYLDKIKAENKNLNAYLEVFDAEAVASAEAMDERIKDGEAPSGLMGVPIAMKDNILIRGHIASAASKILGNYVASYDAFVIEKLRNAGAIFLGSYSPTAVGDYVAGPSHVLPTGGTARFFSGLSVHDFMKSSHVISYSRKALEKIKEPLEKIAGIECLDKHLDSVKIRF